MEPMAPPEDPQPPEAGMPDGTAGPAHRPRLRALPGGGAGRTDPALASVRMVREWRGLTVADLLRPDVAGRLPGQVRSALAELERGDLAAADRKLPEACAPLLPGPGHRRMAQRRARACAAALVVLLAGFTWWLSMVFAGGASNP